MLHYKYRNKTLFHPDYNSYFPEAIDKKQTKNTFKNNMRHENVKGFFSTSFISFCQDCSALKETGIYFNWILNVLKLP